MCKSDTTLLKFAFSLSSLLTNIIDGRLISWVYFQYFSVPTSIPLSPSITKSAASLALSACNTSPSKSKNPGESIKLILKSSYSTGMIEVWIEIPLFFSCAS